MHRLPLLSLSLLLLSQAGCREPTQITVQLLSDLPCNVLQKSGVSLSASSPDRSEASPPLVVSRECTTDGKNNSVGTLVLVPSGEPDALVGIRAVAGVSKQAEECVGPGYEGCVVARREVRFQENESLVVRIELRAECEGNPCDPRSTCVAGKGCRGIEIPEGKCEGGGCGEEELPPSSGGAAGVGGAAGKGGGGAGGISGSSGQAGDAGKAGDGGVGQGGAGTGGAGAGGAGMAGAGGAGEGGAGGAGQAGAGGEGGAGTGGAGTGGAGTGGAGTGGAGQGGAGEGGQAGAGQAGAGGTDPCGDGVCSPDESACSCAADCGAGCAGQGGEGGGAGSGGQGGAGAGGAGAGGAAGEGGAGQSGAGGDGGAGGCSVDVDLACDLQNAACGTVQTACGAITCKHHVCKLNPDQCTAKSDGCDDTLECGLIAPNRCSCNPGEYSCIEDSLFQCSSDGSIRIWLANCDPGNCGDFAIQNGKCLGTTGGYCKGNRKYEDNDMVGGTLCPMGMTCVFLPVNGASCVECVPGSYSCKGLAGNLLYHCGDTGQADVSPEDCSSDILCQLGVHLGHCPK